MIVDRRGAARAGETTGEAFLSVNHDRRQRANGGIAQCCCVTLILLASVAQAEGRPLDARPCDHPDHPLTLSTSIVSFQLENDLFAGTDSQYTNGVRLTWVSPNIESLNDPLLPMWVRCSNQAIQDLFGRVVSGDVTALNMVITLGQAMYTPVDRDRTDIDPKERPYAGWTYLGFGYNIRHDPAGALQQSQARRLDTIEIDIGIVGPHAYAQSTQDLVHRIRSLRRFQGWGNQLNDEFGFQVVREQKLRPPSLSTEDPMDASHGFALQAIPHYGISVGNIASYLNAGVEVRAGWRLPDDFGTSPIRPGGDNAAPRGPRREERLYSQHSFHAFASFDGRIVANNIFLDGNTFRHSHAVKKNNLVADVAYGFAYTWPRASWRPGGKLAYSHYLQTPEFRSESRTHGFGSVSVSLEL